MVDQKLIGSHKVSLNACAGIGKSGKFAERSQKGLRWVDDGIIIIGTPGVVGVVSRHFRD